MGALGSRYRLALAALTLSAVVLAYLPGLTGPFLFDDMQNIVENRAIAVTALNPQSLTAAAESGPGLIGRPLAMLTLAVNHYLAGGLSSTLPFKATNLAIHLINAGLIYGLAVLLLKGLPRVNRDVARWLPFLAALLWALHPIQLAVVLYTVQRMTSLSALFVLAGLLLFVHGRRQFTAAPRRGLAFMGGGLVLGLLLGFAAKENSVLIPLYALVIEYALFDRERLHKHERLQLFIFYTITVALPLCLGLLWLLLHPQTVFAEYASRDFTLIQRLLTETRVLWFYVGLLLFPASGQFGLFHDDLALSTGLLSPWHTLPAAAALLAAVAVAFALRRRAPVATFAILWFLAGHSLEAGVFALEIAHEHRNYLPSFGLLFALSYALCHLSLRVNRRWAAPAIGAAVALGLGLSTFVQAVAWSSEERLIETNIRAHPTSARSHAMYAELRATRDADVTAATRHYRRAIELAPRETAFPLRLVLLTASGLQPLGDRPSNVPMVWQLLGESLPHDITSHLAFDPLTPNALRALDGLRRCVAAKVGLCPQLLPDVIAWHQAALQNDKSGGDAKSSLLFGLFELSYAAGRYQTALVAAEQGARLHPGAPDFLLMQTDALIALNRISDAERTLAQMEANPRMAQERTESLEILREKIRRHGRHARPRSVKPL